MHSTTPHDEHPAHPAVGQNHGRHEGRSVALTARLLAYVGPLDEHVLEASSRAPPSRRGHAAWLLNAG